MKRSPSLHEIMLPSMRTEADAAGAPWRRDSRLPFLRRLLAYSEDPSRGLPRWVHSSETGEVSARQQLRVIIRVGVALRRAVRAHSPRAALVLLSSFSPRAFWTRASWSELVLVQLSCFGLLSFARLS